MKDLARMELEILAAMILRLHCTRVAKMIKFGMRVQANARSANEQLRGRAACIHAMLRLVFKGIGMPTAWLTCRKDMQKIYFWMPQR